MQNKCGCPDLTVVLVYTMKFNYIHACNCVVIATEPASLLQSMTIANVALKRAKRAVIFPQLTDHSQAGWNS